MPGTMKRLFGPVAMSNTLTTNIHNQASALVYDVIRHIHIVNKTAGAVTFSLWLGGTGGNVAGTELFNAHSIPAQGEFDWYGSLRMDSTDFLVGGAAAATSLTITGMGDRNAV